jgi:hypothetical protein
MKRKVLVKKSAIVSKETAMQFIFIFNGSYETSAM